jgi:predicted anti-sigma-YlaC factor YlaD
VASGSAPLNSSFSFTRALSVPLLDAASQIKRQYASTLMKSTPAFFAVGVGQSLDDAGQPALVIYVDRRMIPSELPRNIGGLRTRYIVMDRLHVTRSYLEPMLPQSHCTAEPLKGRTLQFAPHRLTDLQSLAF